MVCDPVSQFKVVFLLENNSLQERERTPIELYVYYTDMCRPKGYGLRAVLVGNRVRDFAFLVYG